MAAPRGILRLYAMTLVSPFVLLSSLFGTMEITAHNRPTTGRRARRSVQMHTLPLLYLPFALASIRLLPRFAVLSSAPLYVSMCTRVRSLAQVSGHPTPTVHSSRCYRRTRNPELCPGRTIWISPKRDCYASTVIAPREIAGLPPLPIRRCPLGV